MAVIGVSLIIASLVLICMRRPTWFTSLFGGAPPLPSGRSPGDVTRGPESWDGPSSHDNSHEGRRADGNAVSSRPGIAAGPQAPSILIQHPVASDDPGVGSSGADSADDGQSTPKARAATVPDTAVPTLSLSTPEPSGDDSKPNGSAPTPAPAPAPARQPASSLMMPPPPRPPTLRPLPNAAASSSPSSSNPSSLAPPPRARNSLSPHTARGPGCSTLAPPPTHTSKPPKPSRQVILSPGHSPLDWARLSGHPAADLRGLAPGTPYLRVTRGMLRRQTGRKGRDAWTVLGGRVYNLSPYLPFHPGGKPELLRGAGRDGTRLFNEVHPWVNYEGMLAACLVGIYVPDEEEEEGGGEAAAGEGKAGRAGKAAGADMEAMD